MVIEVIVVIEVIEVIFFSRRGRLRTPDRTLHLQTVCSKLTAGETPASPDVFRG